MIDIHSHITPGIDDGSKSIEMTEDMMKKAVSDGIDSMCITPHYIYGQLENDAMVVSKELDKLKSLSDKLNTKINFLPGSEIFLSPEIPDLLKEKKLQTLNNGNYVLVELPMGMVPDYTDEMFFQIMLQGYIPVLAHPERNYGIDENPELLEKWKSKGVLYQINSGSIIGIFGRHVQKLSIDFIRKGYAAVVSTDCHSNRGRSPNLSKARKIAEARFGADAGEKLFEVNGLNIIQSKETENIRVSKTRSFFSFFRFKEAL
jgi:Capsular polysaccharide biosynthesis protein